MNSTVIAGDNKGTAMTFGHVDRLDITVQPPGHDGFTLLGQDTPGQDTLAIPAGLIQILDAAKLMPSQTPKSLAGLPMRDIGFTAREDNLAALLSVLNPAAREGISVAAVVGPPGVGKTTLAVAAGHSAKDAGWFPGGVLFLDLHGYDAASLRPEQVADSALRALGVAAEQIREASLDQATSLYRSMLAGRAGPVLILADNASSAGQVRPLLSSIGGKAPVRAGSARPRPSARTWPGFAASTWTASCRRAATRASRAMPSSASPRR